MGTVCIAIIGFILFLISERVLLWYARKRFTLVIHVNGTRGKSTVTRMVHALLYHQGMEVFGKTTGSTAQFLLSDGTEKSIYRFGPANVREQRNMMLLSAFLGNTPKALVFECNAIHEELQHISMGWLKPDITIITNVREDHMQELGTVEQAARTFAAAIPENSVLVTSEKNFMSVWETAAKQKCLRLCYSDPDEVEDCIFPENIACVLGVADYLGIDRTQAMKSITTYKPDAGAFRIYSWEIGFRLVFFADARAANDIESTHRLLTAAFKTTDPDIWRIVLLINREDRPDRTWHFLRYIIRLHKELCFDHYLCLGHIPLSFQRTMHCEGVHCRFLGQIQDLDCVLEEVNERTIHIFGIGNYSGIGMSITQWLEAKRELPSFQQIAETSISKAVQ